MTEPKKPRPVQARDPLGRYDLDGQYERMCVCGHTLGRHAAPNQTRKRSCFAGTDPDFPEPPCDCPNFRLSRKKGT